MSTPLVRQVSTKNIQPECPWPPKGISWTINKLNVSLKDMRPLLVLSMTYHGCQHETVIELEIQLTLLFGLFIAGKCIKHKGYGTFATDFNYAVRRKGGTCSPLGNELDCLLYAFYLDKRENWTKVFPLVCFR